MLFRSPGFLLPALAARDGAVTAALPPSPPPPFQAAYWPARRQSRPFSGAGTKPPRSPALLPLVPAQSTPEHAQQYELLGESGRGTGGLRFLRCWTGGCACFQRLHASGRAGFCLGPLTKPSRAQCRLTTSELSIAPCEALQAVDQTGWLRPQWLWLLLLPV